MNFTNIRWADAAHTTVIAERSDGVSVSIPADMGNADYRRLVAGDAHENVEPAVIAAFARWSSLADAQSELTHDVEAEASRRRVLAVGTSDATKLVMYEHKYAAASAALNGDAGALLSLEAEATARGVSASALAALIQGAGDDWRERGQAIEVASAAHKVAIAVLGDVPLAESYDASEGWPDA